MSIKTRLAAVALAALTITASVTTTTSTAEAKPFGRRFFVEAAASIVGSAIAASTAPYYYSYWRCGWVAQYDAYGHFIGRVRSCY